MSNLFTTLPHTYKDYTYWIAGTPPEKTQEGKYRYYIKFSPKEEAIASQAPFPSVVDANIAARKAIDLAASTETIGKMEATYALASGKLPEPTEKRRRRATTK